MLTILIPAFCEEKQIPQTLEELQSVCLTLAEEVEWLIVDDGSPDQTFRVANDLTKKYPQLRVIRHEKNQGLGAALRTGFRQAKGDFVLSLDCDLSFDPKDIHLLLPYLKEFDVVVGSQHAPGAKMENIPSYRIFLSKLAYFLDRNIFGGNLPSYTSMFVVYRRSLVENLDFESNSFAGQCEVYVRLSRTKARFKGVPVSLIWRDVNRKSSMNIFGEAMKRLQLWWKLNRFRF